MKAISMELAQECLEQQNSVEQVDPFATAMLMGRTEQNIAIANGAPVAEYIKGRWVSALWLKDINNSTVGQKLIVARDCRTRKIALITANYYRLHHLIDQVDRSADTSHSF